MSDLARQFEAADDSFFAREETPGIDRAPDRVDGLTMAALLASIGTLWGAIYAPDTMTLPAVLVFVLFFVLLFGGRADIDN